MIDKVDKASDYRRKRLWYKNQTGRYRRGIGMALWYHGCGFVGMGERDLVKAVAKLRKYPDGSVEAFASNTDIGQGLKTAFSKIVARELNISYEDVKINNPDTDTTPDSGPTVASRSVMIVGELFRRAAIKLRERWIEGEDQIVTEGFRQPEYTIAFEDFSGDAYGAYSWAVCAVEVEVDILTGLNRILGAWGCFDVGTPIDKNIVTGQMEGGMLQGLGFSSMERMSLDRFGRVRDNSYSNYLIPTAMDAPKLEAFLHVEKYDFGPYGAKGAGELPLVGPPPAFVSAMEQALGDIPINHVPFTAEDTLRALGGLKNER
jgi:CO/xanthine dehydrogenase Mo-binding subunit